MGHFRFRRGRLSVFALVLALIAALAGCGKPSGSNSSPRTSASVATSPSGVVTPTAQAAATVQCQSDTGSDNVQYPAPPITGEVWSDDFGGTGPVDPTKWCYDLGHNYRNPQGPPNWGTGQVEEDTASTDNVRLNGQGQLEIIARRDANGNVTSGRIETKRIDFAPAWGHVLRVEASIKLPEVTGKAALGYWPSMFMVGGTARSVNTTNWPQSGEIDAVENDNGQAKIQQTFHCGDTQKGGPCQEGAGLLKAVDAPGLLQGYHQYAVEWDRSKSPEEIRWYLDGVVYLRVTSAQSGMTADAWANATQHGYFVILCVAVGGVVPDNDAHQSQDSDVHLPPDVKTPTDATQFGSPMLVDYLRITQR